MILTAENTELEYSRVVTAKETGQVSDYKDRKAEELRGRRKKDQRSDKLDGISSKSRLLKKT